MIDRRSFLQFGLSLPVLSAFGFSAHGAQQSILEGKGALHLRSIPSTLERIPVIGMGTSRTFDTHNSAASLAQLSQVMRVFLEGGGSVIDSSPMYGQAESRVGEVLSALGRQNSVFAATKVWTNGREQGRTQIEDSAQRMAVKQFGLVAVHNLRDWQVHLATLKELKEQGRVRHIGITTSHGRSQHQLLDIMRSEPLDFVQFSYNIANRDAEKHLLPLAQERGIATMINRPFARGELFSTTRNQALPTIARDLGCGSWAQFFLKFILANSAVTCVIPASAKPHHMADNMQANYGDAPNARQRLAMLRAFEAIS